MAAWNATFGKLLAEQTALQSMHRKEARQRSPPDDWASYLRQRIPTLMAAFQGHQRHVQVRVADSPGSAGAGVTVRPTGRAEIQVVPVLLSTEMQRCICGSSDEMQVL